MYIENEWLRFRSNDWYTTLKTDCNNWGKDENSMVPHPGKDPINDSWDKEKKEKKKQ